jgi:hypothetical protein
MRDERMATFTFFLLHFTSIIKENLLKVGRKDKNIPRLSTLSSNTTSDHVKKSAKMHNLSMAEYFSQ